MIANLDQSAVQPITEAQAMGLVHIVEKELKPGFK